MGTKRITSRVLVASAVVLPASALSSYASGAASSESDSESSDTIAVTAPVVSPDGTVVRPAEPVGSTAEPAKQAEPTRPAGSGEPGSGSGGPDGPGGGTGASTGGDTSSTLTAFPLTDPQAPPTTGSTPLWLLGATHDSLILGAARIDPECLEGNCLGYRAVLATASGRVTGQIDGVYAVHPNGFLERFTGGETDDDFLTRTTQSKNPDLTRSTPNPDEDLSRRQAWAALGRELLDPASGAAADITGLTLSDVPTATTWITARWRPAWSKGDRDLSFAPEADGWMAAPGDPVSTEPTMTMNCAGKLSADSSVITVSLVRTPFTGRPA